MIFIIIMITMMMTIVVKNEHFQSRKICGGIQHVIEDYVSRVPSSAAELRK